MAWGEDKIYSYPNFLLTLIFLLVSRDWFRIKFYGGGGAKVSEGGNCLRGRATAAPLWDLQTVRRFVIVSHPGPTGINLSASCGGKCMN